MTPKKAFSFFLIDLGILSLLAISVVPFGLAQGGSNESGVISSDATWTQANSPYSLTGNVLVDTGVTLTIQAGAR